MAQYREGPIHTPEPKRDETVRKTNLVNQRKKKEFEKIKEAEEKRAETSQEA